MGVLNTTPDSFSDGGTLYTGDRLNLNLTLQRARQMVADGATILDVGGESTRPGATPVGVQQEQDRVFPAVEAIAAELDVTISLDTSTPEVMTGGVALGASVINDVRALQRAGALAAAAATDATVCLMHMQGEPRSMQQSPVYADVVSDVVEFLQQRAAACMEAGISAERLWLDPGFGFGKTVTHNLKLLDNLPTLSGLGFPVLVGFSRKSLIGKLLGREVDERLPASLALAVLAVERGATIVRTHDVRATADALAMVAALEQLDT